MGVRLDSALVSRFVGVIDLQDGLAVHGVGGQRDQYLPVSTFQRPVDLSPHALARGHAAPLAHPSGWQHCVDFGTSNQSTGRQTAGQTSHQIEGDVRRLIDGYHGVGIGSYYVADLDGIRRDRWQQSLIETIAHRVLATSGRGNGGNLFLDLGLRTAIDPGRWAWLESLVRNHPRIVVILATECADDVSLLSDVLSRVPQNQVAVSFDYQDGRWLSASISEEAWFCACRRAEVSTVIGLDLASVGGASIGRTLELCKRIRRQLPQPRYVTGGGIRGGDDAQRLLDAGADQLLVASLFAK